MNQDKQDGKKSNVIVAGLATLAGLGVIATICVSSYIGANNYAAGIESSIKASHAQIENVLANYAAKVKTSAQVSAMARDDAIRILRETLAGRYGDGGVDATMVMIREQNPLADPSVYRVLPQMIESGRNEIQNAQKTLIDHRRNYERSRGLFWRGTWIRIAGFPKIDLDKYNIVTNRYASEAMRTGMEPEVLELRKPDPAPSI